MNKKVRRLFKIIAVFALILGNIVNIYFFKIKNASPVLAATLNSGTLVPGESVDTGGHVLDTTFQRNRNNWVKLASGTNVTKWDSSGNNYFWLNTGIANAWAYTMIDTAIDFSKPFNIAVPSWYQTRSGQQPWTVGDCQGFILTPSDNSKITSNAPTAIGSNLGINGLPNSFFIGRDFFGSSNFDGITSSSGPWDKISIRKTNENGIIESGSNLTWPQISAPANWTGNYWYGEVHRLVWENITNNLNGTFTGTIKFTVTPSSGYTGTPTTITRTVTMQDSMNFGVLGITGGNYGQSMQQGSASADSSFTANRATSKVNVCYIDSSTGKPITNVPNSEIIANVGDTISVKNETSNLGVDTSTYSYNAPPSFTGYTYHHSDAPLHVLRQNYNSNIINYINVYYTPNTMTANFSAAYMKGTPGTGEITDSITNIIGGDPTSKISVTPGLAASLPTPIPNTVTGLFAGPIGIVPALSIPPGYRIHHVVAPDGSKGKTYSDFTSALTANPNFDDISNNAWANHFTAYLAPEVATANFTYKYIQGTRPNAPILPNPYTTIDVTGGVISNPSSSLSPLPTGVSIQNVTAPDGKHYPTLDDALAAGNNKYYRPSTSDFIINVVAPPGIPTLDSVPNIDFGTQAIKGGVASYDTTPSTSLKVTDDSYTNKGWNISVAMNQQFTTDKNKNPDTAPNGTFLKGATLDFYSGKPTTTEGNIAAPPHESNFTLSENGTMATVMSAAVNTGQGTWELPFSNVKLNLINSDIKASGNYVATITWTLSHTP